MILRAMQHRVSAGTSELYPARSGVYSRSLLLRTNHAFLQQGLVQPFGHLPWAFLQQGFVQPFGHLPWAFLQPALSLQPLQPPFGHPDLHFEAQGAQWE